jgi:SAM-dependent MidA family methyltransferase
MSALREDIIELVAQEGPITLEHYMSLALSHPTKGYYMTRDPFGAGGDFITAPEISQMFGELIGLFAQEAWRAAGAPSPTRLVELGPGRGTLMADALRVARIAPDFLAAIDAHLVETSMKKKIEIKDEETIKK